MRWLGVNWFFALMFMAFVSMHLFGHGGHGGTGDGGQRRRRRTAGQIGVVPPVGVPRDEGGGQDL